MTAHLLGVEDSIDSFEKGCALIRANLHLDPLTGDAETWAQHYAWAIFIEDFRLQRQAHMIAQLFGGKS